MHRFLKSLRSSAAREEGVLAAQHLREAISSEIITAETEIPLGNVQPASLDLRLGPQALRLRCSFLPNNQPVKERQSSLVVGDPIDLTGKGALLDRGRPYLIELQERVRLPKEIRARANPKSSTGRADVFTRVITDRSFTFDDIRPGYEGGLYLEVVPLSFAVHVQEGLSLNQLRLSVGNARLSDEDVVAVHRDTPLLYLRGGGAVDDRQVAVSNGLFLRLDLEGVGKGGLLGYKAKSDAPDLDLTRVGEVDVEPYWEPQYRSRTHDGIILEAHRFYLLMSDEGVSIPANLAAEMTAYDPTSGELRTHYAGFFDPGFGYGRKGELRGSTAALEVRAHDVAFLIEHRQRVCKLTFERMLDEPDSVYGSAIASNYQGQTSTLGKHFRPPVAKGRSEKTQPRSDGSHDQLFPVGEDA